VVAPAQVGVDFKQLVGQQGTCSDVQALRDSQSLRVRAVKVGAEMWCDFSTNTVRPLVPTHSKKAIFEALHNLAHPGIRSSKRLIGARFVWHGMASDITAWCRECQQWARGKIHVHVKSPMKQIGVPQTRFSQVHIDIVGPLPTTPEGYTHLLTMIDRTTRWPEVAQLRITSAVECADAFAAAWVAHFGVRLR
jgi:hypothetical protein